MATDKIKILVIDDDELIRMTCRSILQKAGFHVLEASNGAEGVQMYKQQSPDIVLTDVLMPVKEGLETITEIKKISLAARIIAMSGGGATHNLSFLQLAQKIGADKLLSKPVKPDDLLKAVKAILDKK